MAEKTEDPTPRRLDAARRRGDVARSRDLGTFVALTSALVVFWWGGAAIVDALRRGFDASLVSLRMPHEVAEAGFLADAFRLALARLLPSLLAVATVTGALALVETGVLFAPARVVPAFDRLDPSKRLASLLSRRSLVDAGRALLVLLALAFALFPTIGEIVRDATVLVGQPASATLRVTPRLLATAMGRALAVLAAAAALDVFLVHRRHRESLRMTREEVRRDHKESDGDPHAKSARARLHREILEHRVLESVRDADVLVVNPTHLAVALRFDRDGDDEAPTVVAKGEEALARRMIDVARAHGVPVMRDVPLARGLYELELGDEIPEALYVAVAAVLRAAWDERSRGS